MSRRDTVSVLVKPCCNCHKLPLQHIPCGGTGPHLLGSRTYDTRQTVRVSSLSTRGVICLDQELGTHGRPYTGVFTLSAADQLLQNLSSMNCTNFLCDSVPVCVKVLANVHVFRITNNT